MNHTAGLRRPTAMLAVILLSAALLSGCMLHSEVNLVDPAEAVTPLPSDFVMTAFDEEENQPGTFVRGDSRDDGFTLTDNGYVAGDGSMTVYFLPLETDRYRLAIVGEDSTIYGLARLRDGLLELRILFDGDPEAQLAGADLPGDVVIAASGVEVARRATLDAMFNRLADGTLTTTPLLAWVDTAPPPAALVREGDWYRPQ